MRAQFMSLETIKSLGFRTVHQAKLAFYRRAKVCFIPPLSSHNS